MPAPSWRINPARTSSLWLTTSASAGSSRKVGTKYCDQRIISGFRFQVSGARCQMSDVRCQLENVAAILLLTSDIWRLFLCDRDQRQAARRADQTFELEQRHEEVCEIGLSCRDVIAFEQPPVD